MTWVRPTARQLSTKLDEVKHDLVHIGRDPEYDHLYDQRLCALWPDFHHLHLEPDAHGFWACSDGTVCYKATSRRSREVVSFFISAGSVPRVTKDIGATIAMIRRVCVPLAMYGMESGTGSVGTSAKLIWWSAGKDAAPYRGFGVADNHLAHPECKALLDAFLQVMEADALEKAIMAARPQPPAVDPLQEGQYGAGGPGTHDYFSFAD